MKSDKLLEIIGETKKIYVLSALDSRNGKKKVHPHYSLSRIVLIAAMIALLLFLVGCGAYIIVRNMYWSEELKEDSVSCCCDISGHAAGAVAVQTDFTSIKYHIAGTKDKISVTFDVAVLKVSITGSIQSILAA